MALGLFGLSMLNNVSADNDDSYEVTLTNLTKGMTFTPALVATTRKNERLFAAGAAASEALETLAETGNSAPLLDSFDHFDSASLDFIGPGGSQTTHVALRGRYKHISLAAMLIPTNDTFLALNGIVGPRRGKTLTIDVVAYDAGTELNDELCANLPGPGCNGDPGPASDNGEGYVYISNGVRGVGDVDADLRDFNNQVARIIIRRVK
jgi:hypothetical protein